MRTSTPEEPGPSTPRRERVEEDANEPEPRIDSREETESTETTGTTESETGPAAGLRLASVAGSIPGGDDVGVARVSTVSDEVAGASLDALLERARRARARGGRATPPRRRRECSKAKFADWCLCAGNRPARRRVQGAQQQRAPHSSSAAGAPDEIADTAFEHFLDLVIALAEKFHARLEGADARHARHLRRLRRPSRNGDMSP